MNALIPGLSDEHAIQIIQLVWTLEGVEQIILFGSRAKGNFREGPDIDLAIKGTKIDSDALQDFSWKYEKLELPWKIDLVTYSSIKEPALKEHIDRVGRVLPH